MSKQYRVTIVWRKQYSTTSEIMPEWWLKTKLDEWLKELDDGTIIVVKVRKYVGE